MGNRRHELSEKHLDSVTMQRGEEKTLFTLDFCSKLSAFWPKPYRMTSYDGPEINPEGIPRDSMYFEQIDEARTTWAEWIEVLEQAGWKKVEASQPETV